MGKWKIGKWVIENLLPIFAAAEARDGVVGRDSSNRLRECGFETVQRSCLDAA